MIFLCILFLIFAIIFFIGPIIFGAPWIPTRKVTIDKMLSIANIKPGETVYDLGAGDGRIIIAAARDFNAISFGIEVNPFLVLWTRLKVKSLNLEDHVKIIWGSFYKENLSKADVVTLYLWQGTNDKLREKLKKELRPSSRVVSYIFTFTGWVPSKVDEKYNISLYSM